MALKEERRQGYSHSCLGGKVTAGVQQHDHIVLLPNLSVVDSSHPCVPDDDDIYYYYYDDDDIADDYDDNINNEYDVGDDYYNDNDDNYSDKDKDKDEVKRNMEII